MQRPDGKKRTDILAVAAKLFASKPFHEVRLEDVAAEARIGKGTIYIYFKSKEDLYVSLIREGLGQLLQQLQHQLLSDAAPAWERLRGLALELVRFARRYPNFFYLLRHDDTMRNDPKMLANRAELLSLVTEILRQGSESGEFWDEHPELTAYLLLVSTRVAVTEPPPGMSAEEAVEHLLWTLGHGILRPSPAPLPQAWPPLNKDGQ